MGPSATLWTIRMYLRPKVDNGNNTTRPLVSLGCASGTTFTSGIIYLLAKHMIHIDTFTFLRVPGSQAWHSLYIYTPYPPYIRYYYIISKKYIIIYNLHCYFCRRLQFVHIIIKNTAHQTNVVPNVLVHQGHAVYRPRLEPEAGDSRTIFE